MFNMQLLQVCLMTYMWTTQAYPSGPPVEGNPEVCNNMIPQHGSSAQDSSTLPYEVVSSSTCYRDNAQIAVYFHVKEGASYQDEFFQGMFVQGRAEGDADSVNRGTFSTEDPDLQTLSCLGNDNSAVAHSKAETWTCKKFMWTPTSGLQDPVIFHATGVKERNTFWAAFPSNAITYDANCDISLDVYDEQFGCGSAGNLRGNLLMIVLGLFVGILLFQS